MSNKKLLIQIVVIVVAFSGAGLVLYNGFKGSGSAPATALSQVTAVQGTPDTMLPYGDSFNFDKISNHKFQFDIVSPIQLNQQQDVGIPEDNLITPLPPAK